ncbi:uncharacterized protein SPPG_05751 [Spizellomyces punctatus DAOM BR117]|uniref:Uncharacterized protein n=1 Tax=Spizellomyces punctatus (strain DAOM BR117) TaxID=645134 RepID=A0A0L0HB10_SPIPD|nr:uncharacterized protein SPPG_05751 [Spizellomyces punctatus DAOM BR117]KNC98770.1 hypothetical protein SPPG_05751 [Spizellomyces punctatus DAOM BR117]|eukprot:XP_016606810.1 hypothetical protein SPPG_05751 [Spizellomyces punctatus DAOM BR117]
MSYKAASHGQNRHTSQEDLGDAGAQEGSFRMGSEHASNSDITGSRSRSRGRTREQRSQKAQERGESRVGRPKTRTVRKSADAERGISTEVETHKDQRSRSISGTDQQNTRKERSVKKNKSRLGRKARGQDVESYVEYQIPEGGKKDLDDNSDKDANAVQKKRKKERRERNIDQGEDNSPTSPTPGRRRLSSDNPAVQSTSSLASSNSRRHISGSGESLSSNSRRLSRHEDGQRLHRKRTASMSVGPTQSLSTGHRHRSKRDDRSDNANSRKQHRSASIDHSGKYTSPTSKTGSSMVQLSQSGSQRSLHSSRRGRKLHREGSLQIRSPITDQYVTLPISELQILSGEAALDLNEDGGINFETPTHLSHPRMQEMDAVFIEERGRFRPWSSATANMHGIHDKGIDLEHGRRWWETRDGMLLQWATSLHVSIAQITHLLHGIYAGLCLLSLIMLPSFSAISPPDPSVSASVIMFDPTFRFVVSYSTYAGTVNIVFNILATLVLLDVLDIVFGLRGPGNRRRYVWWRERESRVWTALGALLLFFLSWISTVLITAQDDRLSQSQQGVDQGPYGDPGWFASAAALNQALFLSDLSKWRILNCVRGIFGIVAWIAAQWIRVKDMSPNYDANKTDNARTDPAKEIPNERDATINTDQRMAQTSNGRDNQVA